jgi:hypothetical protein
MLVAGGKEGGSFRAIAASLIGRYSKIAQQQIAAGQRSGVLGCEEGLGEPCSEKFKGELDSGLFTAIGRMAEWCPGGSPQALNAIVYSAGLVLGIIPADSKSNSCVSDCDSCFDDMPIDHRS